MIAGRRIAIVDEQQLFLHGASHLLFSLDAGFQVDTFTDPLGLLSDLETGTAYDIVVADLLMGNMNGLVFVNTVRARNIETPILLLSSLDESLPLVDVLKAGADGFITKKADVALFFQAVKTIMDGGVFFERQDLGVEELEALRIGIRDGGASGAINATAPKLSCRQIEILRQIREGMSNKDISQRLSISENTVKSHLKQIFRELNVRKRTASIQKAQMYGLI